MDTLLIILLILVAGVIVYAGLIEPRLVELRHQQALIPRLPAGLDGFRILHISDLHIKDSHRGKARRLLRAFREVRPDIVFITGDLIDRDRYIDYCARFLTRLRAPHGVYGVLGNHDHFYFSFADTWSRKKVGASPNDAAALHDTLSKREVTVLSNEIVRRKVDAEPLWIVGIDEFAEGYDHVDQIFSDIPHDEMLLLLAHTPDMVAELNLPRPAFAFAGHTHGGQIRIPGFGALYRHTQVLDRKSNSGLTTLAGVPVHVSRGFGASEWFPFRLFCRPEVTLLVLKRI